MRGERIGTYLLPLMTSVRDAGYIPLTACIGSHHARASFSMGGSPCSVDSCDKIPSTFILPELCNCSIYLVLSSPFIHAAGQSRTYIEQTLRNVTYFVHFTSHIEGHSTTGKRPLCWRVYSHVLYGSVSVSQHAIDIGRHHRVNVALERGKGYGV